MQIAYQEWIDKHVPDYEHAYGQCGKVTLAMQETFPHLRRVRGFYHCPMIGRRTHWWLEDTDGTVVDPTARQFPSGGLCEYEECNDETRIPTGKCADCGAEVYMHKMFCNDDCARSYTAYCMSSIR